MLKKLQAYFDELDLEVIPFRDRSIPRYRWQVRHKDGDGLHSPVFVRLKDIPPWWKERHRRHLLRDAAIDFLLDEYASGHIEKCKSIDSWVDGGPTRMRENAEVGEMWRSAFALMRSDALPPALTRWKEHMLWSNPSPSAIGDINLSPEAFTARRVELERQGLQKRLRRAKSGAGIRKRL